MNVIKVYNLTYLYLCFLFLVLACQRSPTVFPSMLAGWTSYAPQLELCTDQLLATPSPPFDRRCVICSPNNSGTNEEEKCYIATYASIQFCCQLMTSCSYRMALLAARISNTRSMRRSQKVFGRPCHQPWLV